jgi:hypothetical protein
LNATVAVADLDVGKPTEAATSFNAKNVSVVATAIANADIDQCVAGRWAAFDADDAPDCVGNGAEQATAAPAEKLSLCWSH